MGRNTTPSFVTELPLKTSPAQERVLVIRLDCARQVYNACLGEALKRLALLRQSKAYQAAGKLPKGPKGSPPAKARAVAFGKARAAVGFSEYGLHAYARQFGHSWLGEHLDSHVIQKLATRAFNAVNEYALDRRGRPRFKGKNQFDSLEGKTNRNGIRWRDDQVEWLGLLLPAIIDDRDPVIAHGLAAPIKYVRIVRRKLNGRNRFYVQLVNEGKPYVKENSQLGRGDVGLDVGPSTIATVAPEAGYADLSRFCDELEQPWKEIRRLQRQIDRQRRANNPQNYNPDGTIKPGRKTWIKSKRQIKAETRLAELHRKLAAHRKSLHGRKVNETLRQGNRFLFEDVSYRAFQRRYGRSVTVRAPGTYIKRLKRKAESAGGQAVEFPTCTTRLSQLCHGCGTIEKKSLSQRWHRCQCGVEAQRDLYSAFLATCVVSHNGAYRLDAGLASDRWPGVEPLLQAASSRHQPASNGRGSVSPGVGIEPVACEAAAKPTEAPDVVTLAGHRLGESRGKVGVLAGRTPRL